MGSPPLSRRAFLGTAAGSAGLGLLGGCASIATAPEPRPAALPPVLMNVGHQHDHTDATLRLLAAYGVDHICSGMPSAKFDEHWSVPSLIAFRRRIESYGIKLDAVPLPLSSSPIAKAEYPDILLARDPGRDRAIADMCAMIRHAAAAGIPLLKYNLTFLGVVRTGRAPGRGGASYSQFVYRDAKPEAGPTEAGAVSAAACWERIDYFLERVVPVAEAAGVRIALHPNDPGLPQDRPYQGVYSVLSSVEGLHRFVDTHPSPCHGLNFCQGTISEMLPKPGEQIYDVIRAFGRKGKIFNVHFRNIAGGFLDFRETFPDDGSVDMPRALRTYREVGFAGMVMPDHVPEVAGDADKSRAFSFCFGYIQALLQVLRAESAATA